MPELPEVEVIRRGLLPIITGKQVTAVTSSGKRLRNDIDLPTLQKTITGKRIRTITRRAKYLLFHFYTGDTVIIHLGMTGKLSFHPPESQNHIHDHLFIRFSDDYELRLHDVRRFGSVHILNGTHSKELERVFFKNCGPEPLSRKMSGTYLYKLSRGKKQPIKTFIMDNRIVVGIGNIYANESLFAAGIHPLIPAGSLSLQRMRILNKKIRKILLWAIECGGSTINDFLNASGQQGYFQANFKIYGRENQHCVSCDSLIQKIVVGGRASFFCPCCQKPPSVP